jgi:hypothetical protein
MTKYDIDWSLSDGDWSISGRTTIEAENHDEAEAKFNQLSHQDLVDAVTDAARDSGALEVLNGPESEEDRERESRERRARWAKILEKQETAAAINTALDFYSPDGPGKAS